MCELCTFPKSSHIRYFLDYKINVQLNFVCTASVINKRISIFGITFPYFCTENVAKHFLFTLGAFS